MSNYENSIEETIHTNASNNSIPASNPNRMCQPPTKENNKSIPFWSDNPNILLHKEYIFEFFPTEDMTLEQKLNSVSRLVILLTILGFLFTQNVRLFISFIIIMVFIFLFYTYQIKENSKNDFKKVSLEKQTENFENPSTALLHQKNIQIPTDVFDKTTPENPFSNVLITDYDYNPNKKPAAPSYNEKVNNDILTQAKELVKHSNPDQPDIADKLFRGLGEQLEFEQSLRQFHSNPSTTIPNDQTGFAEFCYGEMISSKEGNMFSLARNLSRFTGN